MTRLLRLTAGDALATVGVLHTTGGLATYRKALPEMVRDGVIDTIEDDPDREAAVWFSPAGHRLS